MAEMETYHAQKVDDFASIAKEHLDGEIEFYEQVNDRSRTGFFSVSLTDPFAAGPQSSTHRAPHVRAPDLPSPGVRLAPAVHLRA